MFNETFLLAYEAENINEETLEATTTKSVEMTITGDDAEYLPNVLAKVTEFLQAAGFTYVETLVAYTTDGSEHVSA